MDRKYRTSHQGIAAYLLTKGYEVERTEPGTTKAGKPCVNIEFNVDQATGRQMGDSFLRVACTVTSRTFTRPATKYDR